MSGRLINWQILLGIGVPPCEGSARTYKTVTVTPWQNPKSLARAMVKNPVLGLFEGTECGDLKQIVTHGAFKMQKQIVSHGAFKMQKKGHHGKLWFIVCTCVCWLWRLKAHAFHLPGSMLQVHFWSFSLRPHCSKLSPPQPHCHFACFSSLSLSVISECTYSLIHISASRAGDLEWLKSWMTFTP